jgi:CheY-like chemotaxis protein
MHAPTIHPLPQGHPGESAVSRPRVLLVEDDDDLRDLLSTVLRKGGYRVYEGPDGLSLLRCLTSAADERPLFDLIVSDIQMPDFTALEVLAALRMRNLSTPIVLISAFADDAVRAEATALGAVALLKKPIDATQLLRAVHDALRATVGRTTI